MFCEIAKCKYDTLNVLLLDDFKKAYFVWDNHGSYGVNFKLI